MCPMHLHVEFLMMEAVLEHVERTLAEIVNDMYCMSKQDVSMLWQAFFLLLEKKPFQSVVGLSCFCCCCCCFCFLRPLRCHGMQIKKQYVYFLLIC